METQKKQIKKHLLEGYSITQLEALNWFGCFRLADVVYKLKADGMEIKTEMIQNGRKRYARYKIYG